MKDDLRKYIAEANGDKPRRIYVAGPMRGYDSYNYPLFYEVAGELRAAGAFVVNPAEVSELIGTTEEIASSPAMLGHLMEADISFLKTCGAIVMLPGWEWSEGAREELQAALALGLKVFQW